MIIDDEPVIRKLLSRMMEFGDYEVHCAEDCSPGMAALRRFKPEVCSLTYSCLMATVLT